MSKTISSLNLEPGDQFIWIKHEHFGVFTVINDPVATSKGHTAAKSELYDIGWFCDEIVKPIKTRSIIRKVTSLEITPGESGRVGVASVKNGAVSCHIKDHNTPMTPDELRAAANLFTQLADALEEN